MLATQDRWAKKTEPRLLVADILRHAAEFVLALSNDKSCCTADGAIREFRLKPGNRIVKKTSTVELAAELVHIRNLYRKYDGIRDGIRGQEGSGLELIFERGVEPMNSRHNTIAGNSYTTTTDVLA